MEDFFLPLKAKAPIIFKVKTASALEFHIQFRLMKYNEDKLYLEMISLQIAEVEVRKIYE